MTVMRAAYPRVSYADLERAPEDGHRYELHNGEVLVVPSPVPRHQIVAQNLWRLLDAYASAHGGLAVIAPIDIVFSQYDVVQPDVVFFTASRRHLVQLDAPIRHAPDLVVEVLSPATAATDRGRKMQMFARYGVPEYWIVDPIAETIEICMLAETGYLPAQEALALESVQSATLPDLALHPSKVFPA